MSDSGLASLFAALADDLEQLARLHRCEIDAATVGLLKSEKFPSGLALQPEPASEHMAATVEFLPIDPAGLDRLAADYAAIYLNHRYGVSPCESVYLSDDHLACAWPMFELRALYAAAGLARRTSHDFDDHLVTQFDYLVHRLRYPHPGRGRAAELACFVDEHAGYWFPDFAAGVARHAETAFYPALAVLTEAWLETFRHCLGDLSAMPRAAPEVLRARIEAKAIRHRTETTPLRFMPGGRAPGW